MRSGTIWRSIRCALAIARNHGALALMVVSAGALFIGNYMAKALLDEAGFVEWSYILTFATILTSYALFGAENMIIRFGRFHSAEDRLSLSEDTRRAATVILPCSALLVFPAVVSWAFKGSSFQYWQLVGLSFMFGAILLGGNVLRVSRRFNSAQMMLNGWRLLAPFMVLYCAFVPGASITNVALAAIGLTLLGWIWFGRHTFPALSFTARTPEFHRVLISFVFSLGVITALGNFDRVVVERVLGPEAFAEYVYLLMYLVFPFNLLSAYLGFREAVEFRSSFSARILVKKTLLAIGLAAAVFIPIAALIVALRDTLMIDIPPTALAMFFILAVVRCGYSITSAAMAALGSAKAILFANTASLGALLVGAGVLFVGATTGNLRITDVLLVVVLVWFVRWMAYAAVAVRLKVAPGGIGHAD